MMLSGENVEKHKFLSDFLVVLLIFFITVLLCCWLSVFRFRGRLDAKMKDEAGRLSGPRGSWVLLSIVTIAFLADNVGGTVLPHFY